MVASRTSSDPIEFSEGSLFNFLIFFNGRSSIETYGRRQVLSASIDVRTSVENVDASVFDFIGKRRPPPPPLDVYKNKLYLLNSFA